LIADLIHKVARESQPPMQEYRPRPSGWGRCFRASTYHALGYEPKLFPGRFVILLEDSSFAEDMTIDWINRTAFKVHSQQLRVNVGTTRGGEEITGSIDGILEDLLGNEYLFEHKGINHFAFERLEASLQDGIWDENLIKYVHQGCVYLVGLGKLSSINRVVFLVKNKNTSAYLEVVGTYDERADAFVIDSALSTRVSEDVESGIRGDLRSGLEPMVLTGVVTGFIAYFDKVEEYALAKTLPPRPYEINDWHCGYCQFQGHCWDGFDKEIAAMSEGVEFPAELRETLLSFIQWRDIEKEAEGKKDEARSILANELQAQGIRKAKTADGISVSLSVVEKTGIDKELIPPAILKAAEKKSQYLKVDVRRPRSAKEKK
jgi:hypothetical protein